MLQALSAVTDELRPIEIRLLDEAALVSAW
jgi:hypothetical protein